MIPAVAPNSEQAQTGEIGIYQNMRNLRGILIFGRFIIFYAIFEFYMVSQRPGRHFKIILRLVAPFSQSMSPWRATATHFVPKSIIIDMSRTCPKDKKPQNLSHRLSKRSIDNKNSTNVSTKLHVFDIHLPHESLFDNPDYVNLALCAQSFRYQVLGTFVNK